MKRNLLAWSIVVAFGFTASGVAAQELSPKELVDKRAKVATAVALAEIAEAEGDGDAMLVAARMLHGLGKVAKRGDGAEPIYYSVADLASAARSLGADPALADELAATDSRQYWGICSWEYICGIYNCEWHYVCE